MKDEGARKYWMERLYAEASLKELMAALAVSTRDARVAVVAASELMNGKRVNTAVLGKFQALARDWAATEGARRCGWWWWTTTGRGCRGR